MATYYSSSNNQRDATPMLYLREPFSGSYPEAPVLPNNIMMYANYSSSGPYSNTLAGNSEHQQNCIEIPSMGASDSTQPQSEILSNLDGSRGVEQDYNAWRDGRNEMLFMQPMGGSSGIPHGSQNLQGQGLSLSLGTQIPSGIQMPSVQYRNPNSDFSSFLSPHMSVPTEGGSRSKSFRDDENSLSKQSANAEYFPPGLPGGNQDSMKADPSPYGMSSIARTIPNSKYLKAAQQLLDEVVNVRKALKQPGSQKNQKFDEIQMKTSKEADGGLKNGTASPSASGMPSNPREFSGNSSSELSSAERQDLQNKLTKLLSMLDEVDRRYRQYYHQMQIVVSSFDVIAGCGAAKPYTALALQTISRHFRCLRDAITGQIRATRKSLGEQDTSANSKGIGISRLRYVDQQLRQQRALQQLGMMQQHTWRPQRGLPESSVSILRAWLFEHFLHPYPKDSDKIMLARQTGLTRSQVSNWFINARVRLWKPMVEEMYKEEIGDAEMDSNSSSEHASKATQGDSKGLEDMRQDAQQSATSTASERCRPGQFLGSKSDHFRDAGMMGSITGASFQSRTQGETETEYSVVKLRGDQRPSMDDCSLYPDAIVQPGGGGERLMAAATAYHMSELGRFGSGSGVALTLGLPHFEGAGLPVPAGTHHGLVSMREDDIYNASASPFGPEAADFDCMDPGSRQHRFSSSHLLHDFVA
ncbi:BEL1-like homeodomain protein 6 [Malania oleifera]|uniref:BEL1-like homeodomain protein 6 n=1 Tax=Malania oleifera TaxID=397392 RepID=UPI0025AE0420|nr:BEL1-like homeodomain protein 6 [Malania oleifera]XP_057966162.1 BEL1-like homeodomain protein 6 [Malania oleifera]